MNDGWDADVGDSAPCAVGLLRGEDVGVVCSESVEGFETWNIHTWT